MASLDETLQNVGTEDEDENLPGVPPTAPATVPTSALASSIQEGVKKIQQSASTGDPSAPAAKQDTTYWLGELNKLSSDPRYQAALPASSKQSLQDAVAQARDLYQQEASKNDWLQVAQTLGRAVAQLGAAESGQPKGYNMSNVNMGPEVDYESRNQRALGAYKQDVGNATLQNQIAREEQQDKDKELSGEYNRRAGYLTQGLNEAEKSDSLESAENRADIRANAAIQAADARARQAGDRATAGDTAAQARADTLQLRLHLQDLDKQDREISNQLQAGRTLAAALQQEPSLNTKEGTKLQEKYSGLAGKAGIDLAPALEQYQNSLPKRNRQVLGIDVPGTETADTSNAKNTNDTLLTALGLTDKIDKLKQIRDIKQQLLGNTKTVNSSTPTGTTAPVAPPASSPPIGTVQGGYKYIGGDPRKPTSWEAVK